MASDESAPTTTPFSLLWTFLDMKPLDIDGLQESNEFPITELLRLLNVSEISSLEKRSAVVKEIAESVPDLKNNAHKRILLKKVLSIYYHKYDSIRKTHPTQWTDDMIPFSLFVFLIDRLLRDAEEYDEDGKELSEKEKKKAQTNLEKDINGHDKCWLLVHYIRRYCTEDHLWDGPKLNAFWLEVTKTKDGMKPPKFNLKAVKVLCKEYTLVAGQYARARKHLHLWYLDALETAQTIAPVVVEEEKQAPPPQPTQKVPASNTVNTQPAKTTSTKSTLPDTTKWYWLDQDDFEWFPYKPEDQKLLNKAFVERKERCDVVEGKFRVEFDKEGSRAGEQYQNNVEDPVSTMVVNTEPEEDGMIHGMEVQDNPK